MSFQNLFARKLVESVAGGISPSDVISVMRDPQAGVNLFHQEMEDNRTEEYVLVCIVQAIPKEHAEPPEAPVIQLPAGARVSTGDAEKG